MKKRVPPENNKTWYSSVNVAISAGYYIFPRPIRLEIEKRRKCGLLQLLLHPLSFNHAFLEYLPRSTGEFASINQLFTTALCCNTSCMEGMNCGGFRNWIMLACYTRNQMGKNIITGIYMTIPIRMLLCSQWDYWSLLYRNGSRILLAGQLSVYPMIYSYYVWNKTRKMLGSVTLIHYPLREQIFRKNLHHSTKFIHLCIRCF